MANSSNASEIRCQLLDFSLANANSQWPIASRSWKIWISESIFVLQGSVTQQLGAHSSTIVPVAAEPVKIVTNQLTINSNLLNYEYLFTSMPIDDVERTFSWLKYYFIWIVNISAGRWRQTNAKNFFSINLWNILIIFLTEFWAGTRSCIYLRIHSLRSSRCSRCTQFIHQNQNKLIQFNLNPLEVCRTSN